MAGNTHVVLLPWSAFGHMMPFYQFAIALAKAGVQVSYVSTPRNIQRLPKVPESLSTLINLVGIPLPKLDDKDLLPEGAEATVDLPFEKIHYLQAAFDLLKKPFGEFVAHHSPDYIIADFSPYWTIDISRENGIPLIVFSAFSAATNIFFGPPEFLIGEGRARVRSTPESLTSPPEWVDFPSSVAFQPYQAVHALPGFYGRPDSSETPEAERVAKMLEACEVLAIRTCTEIEGEYLSLMEKLMKKPVIPVGLLLPEKPEKREIGDDAWVKVFKWLDEQNPKSVLFVGFGSETKMNKDQVFEIAYGLELSELPFIWALRKPDWAVDDLDALPSGFSHRTSDKGIVCFGWAPQSQILAHPSIGGSLFHAGWGSVIETLQHGHCLIVLPLIIDQPLNARLLIDKGLAVEVERSEKGSFSRDSIAKSVRFAMVSNEGEKLRVKARDAGMFFGDQKLNQDHYIGGFVEYLKNEVNKKK